MTRVPVESKMFTSVAHDADEQILYLRFQSGDVYRYFEFPADDYQALIARRVQRPVLPRSHPQPLPLRALGKTQRRLIRQNGTDRTLTAYPRRSRYRNQIWLRQ